MDWLAIVSGAIAGALAAAIASLLTGKSKERRGLFAIVTLVIFLTLKVFFDQAVLPHVRVWQTDRQLRELPFYRDLAEVDPQTYQKVRDIVADSVKKGERADVIVSRISPIVANTLPRYVGAASDESVNGFIDVTIRKTEELRITHLDACYYFLFPPENGGPAVPAYFDQKSQDQMLDVMGRIVHSAVHAPQPLPDSTRAQLLLVPVLDRLRDDFGSDLSLLQQKPTDTTGRQKVCDMAISLYKNVEDLPPNDASLLLRYLLSDEKSHTGTQ